MKYFREIVTLRTFDMLLHRVRCKCIYTYVYSCKQTTGIDVYIHVFAHWHNG